MGNKVCMDLGPLESWPLLAVWKLNIVNLSATTT